VLALLLGWAAGHARAQDVLLDGIAAQVGNEIVLLSEVQELAKPVEERMRAQGVGEKEVRAMHGDALERLIESKLIEGIVKRMELEATDAEIDEAILGIAKDTGLTINQLKRSVVSHGLTVDEYRGKLKGEIERSKVLNMMVRSRIRVEPAELKQAYEERYGDQKSGGEELHLRHILVAFGGDSLRTPDTARTIAADAERKIKRGDISFTAMARRATDMQPERGGELGWLHVEDLAPWMIDALRSMKPGDVSGVIETSFGCNLLELVERRDFEPVSFKEAEGALIQQVSGQKMERAYVQWLETLRKQTYISRKGLYAESSRASIPTDGPLRP
jgi:peptidyl-prolyl cis-trans isomerase SurA